LANEIMIWLSSIRNQITSLALLEEPSCCVKGLEVYDASTFGSALEYLKSAQVHGTSCLITDVQMPGLSGIELQDRLIARGHHIPIIFITGHPDEGVRARAMKAGAVSFLIKPFSPDHFVGCIDKALKAA
jgi:FixJ family two-component response regulator